ncbi:adenosylcobinamide-GDP ribazoletransferase [Alkalihalobacillus sp. MEB130]|uniref:adenosylcobinamide-GDP ribazoletransferase n=1 Tax=Alkalihalobacillus sp. MEB130 TaxID=2976704 RepID=UPI0028DEF2B9|nr:adenosylcobinamide-GDP ribazoletransferase [Alkalihalobacillus sp. MEB130]MDT8859291.1 adenosylcobinamide-GDP ribazoletransferase [Alkalihalobacillus sp. MEB130]
MKQMVFGLIVAIQFLTRLPVPINVPWNKQTSKWAIRSYPFVGIVMGLLILVVAVGLESHLSISMMALLTVTVWVWLTGGLHLDGWMDVADALGSNASLEKKWEIMKDPHVGSFGIIALLFLLGWKVFLIYSLFEIGFPIFALLFILAFSRLGAVIIMIALPTAKQQGLAWEWKKNIDWKDGLYAFIPIVAILILFEGFLFFIPAYLLFITAFGVWVKYKFKGTNGDLLGTAIEGGELWGLVITWMYFSFVMG